MNPIGSKHWRHTFRSSVWKRGPLAFAVTTLLAVCPCPGGPTISVTPHPSVARLTALERNAQALGSGTLIDTRDQFGLVITNYHVIRDATRDVLVTFPNGFRSNAQILQVDKDWEGMSMSLTALPAADGATNSCR